MSGSELCRHAFIPKSDLSLLASTVSTGTPLSATSMSAGASGSKPGPAPAQSAGQGGESEMGESRSARGAVDGSGWPSKYEAVQHIAPLHCRRWLDSGRSRQDGTRPRWIHVCRRSSG
jgi:hypothetical protein